MMLFRLMDTEMVINEVRTHECLWNTRNAFYKHKIEKYKAWEEVSEVVIPKYKTCSEDDKKRIVRAVQARWKTARDAYIKCRYTERTKKPRYKSRQHTYIYKDKLTFLEQSKDLDDDANSGRFEDEEGSSSIVENSTSRSTYGVSDEEAACDETMDYDIDIHEDFKDNIQGLITDETDVKDVNDKAIMEVNEQDCLSAINDQEDPLATANTINQSNKKPRIIRPRKIKRKMSEFEFKLLKIMRLKNNINSSALKADDQFFFDSLAPLIENFDAHQKLKFRSKILELVMEVGNIRPVTVKQENEIV